MNALDCGAGNQVARGDGRAKGAIGAKRDSDATPAPMECVDDGDGGGWVEMGRMGDTRDGAALLEVDPDGGVWGAADGWAGPGWRSGVEGGCGMDGTAEGDGARGARGGDMVGTPPPCKDDVTVGDVPDVDEEEVVEERDGEEDEEAEDSAAACVDSPVSEKVNLGAADLKGVAALSLSVVPPPSSSAPPPPLLLLLLLPLASCIHAA